MLYEVITMIRLQKKHDLLGGIRRVKSIILGEDDSLEGRNL